MASISSPKNPIVKDAVGLLKRRERDRSGRFLIEGGREVRRAFDAGIRLERCFVHAERSALPAAIELIEDLRRAGVDVVEASPAVFDRLTYRESTEPVVAVAQSFPTGLDRLAPGPHALLLVVTAVEKPGNLGAMVRTAAAAGVDGLILADPVTDVGNPNVVRASVGAVFTVPLAVCTTREAIEWLRARHIPTFAATPDGGVPPWAAPLGGPAAIVVGAEDAGLPDAWLDAADHRITIPMAAEADSGADSMNVATAAAVVLFDAVRQRDPA